MSTGFHSCARVWGATTRPEMTLPLRSCCHRSRGARWGRRGRWPDPAFAREPTRLGPLRSRVSHASWAWNVPAPIVKATIISPHPGPLRPGPARGLAASQAALCQASPPGVLRSSRRHCFWSSDAWPPVSSHLSCFVPALTSPVTAQPSSPESQDPQLAIPLHTPILASPSPTAAQGSPSVSHTSLPRETHAGRLPGDQCQQLCAAAGAGSVPQGSARGKGGDLAGPGAAFAPCACPGGLAGWDRGVPRRKMGPGGPWGPISRTRAREHRVLVRIRLLTKLCVLGGPGTCRCHQLQSTGICDSRLLALQRAPVGTCGIRLCR